MAGSIRRSTQPHAARAQHSVRTEPEAAARSTISPSASTLEATSPRSAETRAAAISSSIASDGASSSYAHADPLAEGGEGALGVAEGASCLTLDAAQCHRHQAERAGIGQEGRHQVEGTLGVAGHVLGGRQRGHALGGGGGLPVGPAGERPAGQLGGVVRSALVDDGPEAGAQRRRPGAGRRRGPCTSAGPRPSRRRRPRGPGGGRVASCGWRRGRSPGPRRRRGRRSGRRSDSSAPRRRRRSRANCRTVSSRRYRVSAPLVSTVTSEAWVSSSSRASNRDGSPTEATARAVEPENGPANTASSSRSSAASGDSRS